MRTLDRMRAPKREIFLTQPLDHSSEKIFDLVHAAALSANASVVRADSATSPGMDLLQSVHLAIRKASLVVADVSHTNPSVMYEIGFAQAQNKPILLIANNRRNVPFDLASMRIVVYELANVGASVSVLARMIALALEKPEALRISEVIAEREHRRNVFISYSHSDREYVDRLLVHLKPLERDGLIELWVDTRLRAGDRWIREIEKALERANVAILLVSADFLASDFITNNELPPLLKNAEQAGTRIVPLIVKPCRFARDKNLRHFQAINDPKHPIALLSQGAQEVLYDEVAAEVERSLDKL